MFFLNNGYNFITYAWKTNIFFILVHFADFKSLALGFVSFQHKLALKFYINYDSKLVGVPRMVGHDFSFVILLLFIWISLSMLMSARDYCSYAGPYIINMNVWHQCIIIIIIFFGCFVGINGSRYQS